MVTECKTDDTFSSLLDCAKAFDSNGRAKLSAEAIPGEISRIANDAAYLAEIASTLVPADTDTGEACLHRIQEFVHSATGIMKSGDCFVPLLKAILLRMSETERIGFLNTIVEPGARHFWSYAIVLKDVLPIIPLSAMFLSEWLPRLVEQEGNDMAGGNAFAIAFSYSRLNPDVGLSLAELYMGVGFDKTKSIIVQEVLGGLRVSENLNDELRIRLQDVEQKLSGSSSVDWRVCFHRSWAATLINQPFDKNALLEKVSAMMAGELDEQTAAFYVVRRWMLHFIHTESADSAKAIFIEWLLENSKTVLPDYAKHEVAVSLERYTSHLDGETIPEDTARALLQIAEQIQPIPLDNKGTWHYLVEFSARITKNAQPDQWVEFWKHLVAQDPEHLLIENLDHNSDAMFWYYIEEAKHCKIVTRLLFHKDGLIRRYGQAFFTKVKQPALDDDFLASISDKRILLGLLDFTQRVHSDNRLLPFVVGIAPRLSRVADGQIQERCLFAIRLLIINYPGTLIETVKNSCSQHPVLAEPVQAAEKYFEALRQWQNSPINSFLRHEFIDSARMHRRNFDSQMRTAVRKGSLMAALCGEPTGIIYGDGFEIVHDGKISDKTPFQRFSSSFEMPHLTMFDPEGDWIRRMQKLEDIEVLEND